MEDGAAEERVVSKGGWTSSPPVKVLVGSLTSVSGGPSGATVGPVVVLLMEGGSLQLLCSPLAAELHPP